MDLPDSVPLVAGSSRRSTASAALAALRPRQWTKNLLLFAGIVFAAELDDPSRWLSAVVAFAAYCAGSGAAYLVNDAIDADDDRAHATKRDRPIARGDLTIRTALAVSAALAVGGAALVATLGPASLVFFAGFLAAQGLYSLVLKRVPLLDIAGIAALFVIRAAAGAAAVDVRISPWLLLCTALLALFLALAKRRAELVRVDAGTAPGRAALQGYDRRGTDRLLVVSAVATTLVYTLYTLDASAPLMPLTVPFVAFGLGRYLSLARGRGLGEEPEDVLASDVPIVATVAAWIVTAAVVLALR